MFTEKKKKTFKVEPDDQKRDRLLLLTQQRSAYSFVGILHVFMLARVCVCVCICSSQRLRVCDLEGPAPFEPSQWERTLVTAKVTAG